VQIAIMLFPDFTALDAVGPYEVLQRLPGAELTFVASERGPVSADSGVLTIEVPAAFEDVPSPDIVVVPGGIGSRQAMVDDATLDWVRQAHETSRYTTSVCTGSLVLAGAGLLDGLDATTHWGEMHTLGQLGAHPVEHRVVQQGRIITSAGVSSGIDMALTLAAMLSDERTAKAIQLMIEYDPQPPFDAGSLARAGDDIVERIIEMAVDRPDL
jgi:transcriptional regulator GlxA family with amidase domain